MYFSSKVLSNRIHIPFEFPILSTIEEHFSAITDERQQYKVRYPVHDILLITLVGVTCDADGWKAIEEVGKNKLKLLKKVSVLSL
jgi:hypothetical protein